tara:strand:+ start:1198 stop:1506 length:309 start_codon:yes stop_codon:yes gene_type:complete
MNFPKTVKIAGRRIRLVIKPFRGEDRDTFGEYFHDDKTIQINAGLSDEVALTTLRHEMMEASLFISGLAWSERYEQEPIVRCMEEIFFPAWETFLKRIQREL